MAAKLGNAKLQPMISRYENPDYGKYSVTTLLELARVFDVALVVRFAKFSELVRWDLHKTSATLQPASFASDVELLGMGTETWMWRQVSRTQIAAPVSVNSVEDANACAPNPVNTVNATWEIKASTPAFGKAA